MSLWLKWGFYPFFIKVSNELSMAVVKTKTEGWFHIFYFFSLKVYWDRDVFIVVHEYAWKWNKISWNFFASFIKSIEDDVNGSIPVYTSPASTRSSTPTGAVSGHLWDIPRKDSRRLEARAYCGYLGLVVLIPRPCGVGRSASVNLCWLALIEFFKVAIGFRSHGQA